MSYFARLDAERTPDNRYDPGPSRFTDADGVLWERVGSDSWERAQAGVETMPTKCQECGGSGVLFGLDTDYEECFVCDGTGWSDKRFRCHRCASIIVAGVNAHGPTDDICLDCAKLYSREWADIKASSAA